LRTNFLEPAWIEAIGDNVIRANLTTNLTLQCRMTGEPLPSIKWFKPKRSTGATDALTGRFFIESLTRYDQGQYRCQASNLGGIAEEKFTVLINGI